MKGIFIGYYKSATQYRVYVPSLLGIKKIFVPANMKFLEKSFWNWQLTSAGQMEDMCAAQTHNPACKDFDNFCNTSS